jgi:hypothetical protein
MLQQTFKKVNIFLKGKFCMQKKISLCPINWDSIVNSKINFSKYDDPCIEYHDNKLNERLEEILTGQAEENQWEDYIHNWVETDLIFREDGILLAVHIHPLPYFENEMQERLCKAESDEERDYLYIIFSTSDEYYRKDGNGDDFLLLDVDVSDKVKERLSCFYRMNSEVVAWKK